MRIEAVRAKPKRLVRKRGLPFGAMELGDARGGVLSDSGGALQREFAARDSI